MKANNAYRILYESRRLTLKFFLKSDLTKTRKHSLKEIFFLSLIIFFLAPNPKAFALSGYSYSKTIPVYGSSSCKIAAGYVLPIRVCPDADPVQAGSWPVNGKLYSHRIAISVQEVSHKNLNDYLMWFEFHTDILIRRFYINKGFPAPAGNEFEFVDASAKSALLYNYAVAAFNGPRTRYFVQIDLAANQSKIVYFYFDPLQIHPSSNYRSTLVFSSTVPDNQYLRFDKNPEAFIERNILSFAYNFFLSSECKSVRAIGLLLFEDYSCLRIFVLQDSRRLRVANQGLSGCRSRAGRIMVRQRQALLSSNCHLSPGSVS